MSHLSLECGDSEQMSRVRARLTELGVPFRQNISVPDPKKSRANTFEDADKDGAAKPTTGVIQFFLTDPDGHYIELCNCDLLTKFCFSQEAVDLTYDSAAPDVGAAVGVIQARWRSRAMRRSLGGVASVKELTQGYTTRSQRIASSNPGHRPTTVPLAHTTRKRTL